MPFAVQFEDSIARERLLSALSSFFAVLTLLLSGIGVYGLIGADVARRTTEVGIRMALGATRANIFRLVMSKAVGLLAVGVLAGNGLALLAGHLLRAFLYGVSPRNPLLFGAGVALLVVCGGVAALVPASRAILTEPVEALRSE